MLVKVDISGLFMFGWISHSCAFILDIGERTYGKYMHISYYDQQDSDIGYEFGD